VVLNDIAEAFNAAAAFVCHGLLEIIVSLKQYFVATDALTQGIRFENIAASIEK
jgi:hypothetical protein